MRKAFLTLAFGAMTLPWAFAQAGGAGGAGAAGTGGAGVGQTGAAQGGTTGQGATGRAGATRNGAGRAAANPSVNRGRTGTANRTSPTRFRGRTSTRVRRNPSPATGSANRLANPPGSSMRTPRNGINPNTGQPNGPNSPNRNMPPSGSPGRG